MLNLETLTALQQSQSIHEANNAVAVSKDTKDIVALPSDYKLSDLEQYLPARRRARGTMSTSLLESFAKYVKDQAEATSVFVDADKLKAVAVLNLGTPERPGHADNLAALELKKTAAYTALTGTATGLGHAQKAIAEFLEDWADCVQCFDDAGEIKTSKAVAAVRKITIESMRKMESEEQSLGATKSAFESVQASSKEPLPAIIYFKCEPYAGLEQRLFVLRLGVLTGEAVPKVNLRIIKAEQHQEEMAQELAVKTRDALGDDFAVMLGNYKKAE
jgi:uncharacterized protein YfdQ (DUF2303 family)